MTTRGSVCLEIEALFEFETPDGHAPNCRELSIVDSRDLRIPLGTTIVRHEGKDIPVHVGEVLWRFLSSLRVGDEIQDAALANAEDAGDDDYAADDSRMPGAAE